MAERLQYPIWAPIDPETLDAPLRDELQWYLDFSFPVWPEPTVASFPSFFIDPEALGAAETIVVTLDEYQALAEPVLPEHQTRPGWFTIDPEALAAGLRDEIQWYAPFAEPVLPEHQTRPGWYAVDPTTLDDPLRDELQWFMEFSVPVLPEHQVRTGTSVIDTESLGEPLRDELQWFQPFSDPIREVIRVIEAGNIFVDEPAAVAPDDELEWFQGFSLPVWQLSSVSYAATQSASGMMAVDISGTDSGTRRQRQIKSLIKSRRRRKR